MPGLCDLFINLSLSVSLSPDYHCSNALGMKSGKISDDQITASSVFYDGRWNAQQARLHNEDHGWTPSTDSQKEYIQVR